MDITLQIANTAGVEHVRELGLLISPVLDSQ